MEKEFNPQDYIGKTYYYADGTQLDILVIDAIAEDSFNCEINEKDLYILSFADFQEQIENGELQTADEVIKEMKHLISMQEVAIREMRDILRWINERDQYQMCIEKGIERIDNLIN